MLIEWLLKGGVMMYILILTSFLFVAVVIERFTYFKKTNTKISRFINQFYDCLDVYQIEAAEDLCKQNPSPVANIALAALSFSDRDHQNLKESIEEAGRREIPALESNLGILSTIAYISPLLGLLGTVLGLISSFQSFQEAAQHGGTPGPELLATGIWEALITTVAGLSLGILSYIIHNYLYIKKERMISDLESASHELYEIIVEKRNPST